jgi:hypothetical protein
MANAKSSPRRAPRRRLPPRPVLVERLARAFIRELRRTVTVSEFAAIVRKNSLVKSLIDGTCASHDYCDGNMVMHAAWRNILRREPVFLRAPIIRAADRDRLLWNDAWTKARYAMAKGEVKV